MKPIRFCMIAFLLMGMNIVASADSRDRYTFELLERLQQMEEQVQALNGQVEVLNHQLHALQQRQLAQFKDLDARVAQLGQSAQPALKAATGQPAAASVTQASSSSAAAVDSHVNVDDEQDASNTNQASSASHSATMPVEHIASDRADYQQAFAYIKEKRYPQASQAMQAFLKTYPDSPYVANAHYWLGELDLLTGDINAAIQEFTAIVTQHAQHSKAADAMLKLGYIYDDIGQFTKAREYLTEVRNRFPSSTAAQLAQTRLVQMNRA